MYTRGQGTQGPWPKKSAWAGPRPGPRPFWALAPGFPGPEHAQECCACTRDLLCIHKRFFCVYTIGVISYYYIIILYYPIVYTPPPCQQLVDYLINSWLGTWDTFSDAWQLHFDVPGCDFGVPGHHFVDPEAPKDTQQDTLGARLGC